MTQQGQGDVVARLRERAATHREEGWELGNDPELLERAAELIDRLYDENHAIKYEVMGGEDVPGSASAATIEDVRVELTRLRALLSSSRGERGWRTIDSAPKDGADILFLRAPPYSTSGNYAIGFWDGEDFADRCGGLIKTHVYTHWQPLPSAPGSVPTSPAGQVPDGYVLVPKEPTEQFFEEAAYDFCKAQGRDPDEMTYITDEGIQQPYGPAWMHYVSDVRHMHAALIQSSPQPTAGGDAPEKEDWWDAAALLISEDVLGRRYGSADEMPEGDARILYGIVASVETAMINAGAQPGNVLSDALSAERARVIEECAKVAQVTRLNFLTEREKLACEAVAAALRALGQQDTGGAG